MSHEKSDGIYLYGRITDRPDMTLDVYRGRKTTMQQQKNRMYIIQMNVSYVHLNDVHSTSMCTKYWLTA